MDPFPVGWIFIQNKPGSFPESVCKTERLLLMTCIRLKL